MKAWTSQLRKGLVELCVLAALSEADEAYGYEILQRLARAEGLAVSESTVYPILARLAAEGMVRVRVAPSPAGPPRRYYRLTAAGRARLAEMRDHWRQLAGSVDAMLKGVPSS